MAGGGGRTGWSFVSTTRSTTVSTPSSSLTARDLPDRITVDVSALNIGDSVHVRDIQLPSGVTAKVQPDLTAFSVVAPIVEEEPVVAAAEAAAAGPEVITEKKEEGEAAAAGPAAKEKAPKEREQKK